MSHHKIYLAITIASLLIFSADTYAETLEKPNQIQTVTDIIDQEEFISIPLNIEINTEDALELNGNSPVRFEDDSDVFFKYDFLGKLDAGIGVLGPEIISDKYNIKSGALPRGRYIEPINKKFGAGISSKF